MQVCIYAEFWEFNKEEGYWKMDPGIDGGKEGSEKKKYRPPTCLGCESNRLCALASSRKIPLMFESFSGVPAHNGGQYSKELQTKAL